jgi:hypothetical protein
MVFDLDSAGIILSMIVISVGVTMAILYLMRLIREKYSKRNIANSSGPHGARVDCCRLLRVENILRIMLEEYLFLVITSITHPP